MLISLFYTDDAFFVVKGKKFGEEAFLRSINGMEKRECKTKADVVEAIQAGVEWTLGPEVVYNVKQS